jgi:iron complex transport system permease protein
VFAFTFALGAAALVILVSYAAGANRYAVILAGVAVSTLLSAFISAFTLADTDILASYNAFSIGGLSGVTYRELIIPAAVISVCVMTSLLLASQLNLLSLGTRSAALLGVNVRSVTLIAIICSAASAASVVSFAGLLGFVGLIVPHISRALVGHKISRLIPASAILGASVVLLADLIGRVLIAPSEIPVGITMALVGAPFFIFLLIKKRGEY